MTADPLLTLPQAAAILGVSTQKARRLIRAQLIEYNPRLRRSLRLSEIQRVAEALAPDPLARTCLVAGVE